MTLIDLAARVLANIALVAWVVACWFVATGALPHLATPIGIVGWLTAFDLWREARGDGELQ